MANEMSINAARTQLQGAALEQATKLAGDATKAKEIVGKAMEILAGVNLKVTRSDDMSATGAGEKKTTGATNVPSLDNPGDVKQIEANLEKLLAYLQLDNEERQTQMTKDRIEMQKDNLATEHKGRMEELQKSFKKMDEAEASRKASRVFGWLGAIMAVVAAVVVSVVTGGTAAAFAIAGAALAVSTLIMNETGAMEAITKKLAEHLQDKYGLSKSQAQLAASLIINISLMLARGQYVCQRGRSRLGRCDIGLHLQVGGHQGRFDGARKVHPDAPAASRRERGRAPADRPADPVRNRKHRGTHQFGDGPELRDRKEHRPDGLSLTATKKGVLK